MSGKRKHYVSLGPDRCAGPFHHDEMVHFLKLLAKGEALNDYDRWLASGSPLRFEEWLRMVKSLTSKVEAVEQLDRTTQRLLEVITAVARHRERKGKRAELDDIDRELYASVPELREME